VQKKNNKPATVAVVFLEKRHLTMAAMVAVASVALPQKQK